MLYKIMNHKYKFILLTVLSFLLGGSIFFSNSTPTRSEKPMDTTPTVFVHGFKGGHGSFNTMLDRFENNNWGKKRMLVYVTASGDVKIHGGIPSETNPFIQVIFENNRASIAQQTNWMQKILTDLKEHFSVDQVNLVGHSMGGLASANFLLNNQEGNYPDVKKLVTIGSPFLGIGQEDYFALNTGEATVDLQVESNALLTMLNSKDNFDEDIQTFSIAGVINEEDKSSEQWDGLVTAQSAHGIKGIVPNSHYKKETFRDKGATHSGLHEHTGVDQSVAEFLWNIH
ncbi:alpha/beta fold hydrolase [Halobacillus sp. A1]|uniref:alpha/beta fold hydrolase n=1 Tax=Halobacillus sp. A1 TaxID=2880262 RepID=UPI0020A6AC19|nr:alpha/beta fold hydrolase [Halobacillus sp. A1]MCP3031852.1 alpha/beta fold hydrolase [Halobacillus sp. A1]